MYTNVCCVLCELAKREEDREIGGGIDIGKNSSDYILRHGRRCIKTVLLCGSMRVALYLDFSEFTRETIQATRPILCMYTTSHRYED